MSDPAEPLIEITGLSVHYQAGAAPVQAVDDVDLTIRRGEAMGLAGESGSGKTTLGMAVTRLLRDPAKVVGGRVVYHGPQGPVDLMALSDRELRAARWQEVAVVLQSAMNALNPVLSLRAQFDDVLKAHRRGTKRAARLDRSKQLLEVVGIDPQRISAYPHELSGGMRQRAMIAMALALDPQLIIMDEPTTALDVVTQRQIITELARLRGEFGFAMLFVTHDLSLLLEIADRIAIMYAGRIVEMAGAEELHHKPAHPYTEGLLRSFPPVSGPRRTLVGIPGTPPSLRGLPPGCRFAPRCGLAADVCRQLTPELLPSGGEGDRLVACHRDLLTHDARDPIVSTATEAGS